MGDIIGTIIKLPTSTGEIGDLRPNEDVHESLFRSYHLLEYVLELIERRVDPETINEIVIFCQMANRPLPAVEE